MIGDTMRRHLMLAGLCTAFVSLAQAGFAQALPERFRGVWKYAEKEPDSCKQTDWKSAAHTDGHINVTPRQIVYYESTCRYASIQTARSNDANAAVRVTLSCKGEGETWRSVQVWQVRKIGGRSMLIAAATNPGREFIAVYQGCDPA